ncbi:hypothetical protein H112_00488, partial [Trichophyton rubrum D6]
HHTGVKPRLGLLFFFSPSLPSLNPARGSEIPTFYAMQLTEYSPHACHSTLSNRVIFSLTDRMHSYILCIYNKACTYMGVMMSWFSSTLDLLVHLHPRTQPCIFFPPRFIIVDVYPEQNLEE